MKSGAPRSFGAHLKALREAAGYTQEELATIAGLSVHAISALERGTRRRPQLETVRALSAALDLSTAGRDALLGSARASGGSAAARGWPAGVLPTAPTPLLGRDEELQTLRSWLAGSDVRLMTLTGPGGVGKTRLAIEAARAIATEDPADAAFVPLSAIRNPTLVAAAIAEALELSDVSANDLPKRVATLCADRAMLLLLDNFEQVLDAAPLVAELLASAARLKVLVTSRAPLRLRGEREFAVGPLAIEPRPDATAAVDRARSPAVRLFAARARDVQPGFRLTDANSSTVTAICRRLDALPLALELAAPWMKVLSADDLLDRLTRDDLLSTAAPRDLPERQQTMNATVAWSYQLLALHEQRAFRRLGVLPGRFPLEAAAAVLSDHGDATSARDEALAAVAGLIDKSLLMRVETTAPRPLYQMLETVRAFATLELTGAGEREAAIEGLARHCRTEATLAAERLAGPAQAETLDRVQDDLENHRAALAWLVERGRADEAAAIASGLVLFWLIRGYPAEGLRWFEQILNLRARSRDTEAHCLVGSALMLYMQGELARARETAMRGLSVAEKADDPSLVPQVETMLGHIEHGLGNLAAARDRFTRGADGFRAVGLEWGAGTALSGKGGVALAAGDTAEAERLLDEATAILRHAGPWFLTPVLCFRASLAVQRGNAPQAIACIRESLTYIRQLRDKYAFVYALLPLAAAAVLDADDEWAARILGARDAVIERTGSAVAVTFVNALQEQVERGVRERLGPDRWAAAYAAGRSMSIDMVIKDLNAVT